MMALELLFIFVCFACIFSCTVLLSLKLHELIFRPPEGSRTRCKKTKKKQKMSSTVSSHSKVVNVGKQTNTARGLY